MKSIGTTFSKKTGVRANMRSNFAIICSTWKQNYDQWYQYTCEHIALNDFVFPLCILYYTILRPYHGHAYAKLNINITSGQQLSLSMPHNILKLFLFLYFYNLKQGCQKCGSRANSALWLMLLGSLHDLDI